MTNALFPFIKLGPTTVSPADAHTRTQAHALSNSVCWVNLAAVKVYQGSLVTLSSSLTGAACQQTFVRG